jgi:hypothetical protein
MLRPVKETVVGQSLRKVSHEARQLTPYGASGTLGRRLQALKGAQQEGGESGVVDFKVPAATDGALALLVHGWEGDEYIGEKGSRFRDTKAARPIRRGAWPDLVSAPFSPRL